MYNKTYKNINFQSYDDSDKVVGNPQHIKTVSNHIKSKCETTQIINVYRTYMSRFTSTVPARGARTPNRAISNSCL